MPTVATKRLIVRLTLALALLLVTVFSAFFVAPPQHVKAYTDPSNNYPSKWAPPVAQDSVVDDWGEYNRECTSWASFALHDRNGYEIPFHDYASGWGADAKAIGFPPNSTPALGAIAWWAANAPGASQWGHVAWVSNVDANGGITIEQYNADFTGTYSTATFAKGSADWPTGFIHFKDINPPIFALKTTLRQDGAIETFAATTGQVFGDWYFDGGDGPHNFSVIKIS